MGVRDPGRYLEFLCGCKRPGEISRNFCVGVRDRGDIRNFCVNEKGSKCKSKSYVARDENTRTWLSRRLRVE